MSALRGGYRIGILIALIGVDPTFAHEQAGENYEGYPIAIDDISVVDVVDGTVTPAQTVVVRYGKVAYIKPSSEFEPPGWMNVLDGTGKYLIPGLWDSHVHLSFWDEPEGEQSDETPMVENDYGQVLLQLVSWGVTSVRDMGGDLAAIDDWRGRIANDEVLGPTVYRAGPFVDGPKPNARFRRFVTNAAEAHEVVSELKRDEVDFIKVHSQVPPDVLPILARYARQMDLKLAGHVPYGTSIQTTIELGFSTVEHADALFISQLGSREGSFEEWKAAYEWYFTPAGERLLGLMAERDVYFTPTLTIFNTGWEGVGEPWNVLRDWYRDLARLAHGMGVQFLAGTDFARKDGPIQPGIGLHEELVNLVDIGLEPLEALRTATINPAALLGHDDEVGRIEPGMVADLVVLGGNPLIDISKTRAVEAVVLRGRLLDAAMIRAVRGDVASEGGEVRQ